MTPMARRTHGRAPDFHAETSRANSTAVSSTAKASLFTYPAVNANWGRKAIARAPQMAIERARGKTFLPIQNVITTVPRYEPKDTNRAGHIEPFCVNQPAAADNTY